LRENHLPSGENRASVRKIPWNEGMEKERWEKTVDEWWILEVKNISSPQSSRRITLPVKYHYNAFVV
jgi:hypothetical protein